jgi:hypothetical protein
MKKKVNNMCYLVVAAALVLGMMWAGVLPGWNASTEYLNKGGVTKDFACVQEGNQQSNAQDAGVNRKLVNTNGCKAKYAAFDASSCTESSSALIIAGRGSVGSLQENTWFEYDAVCNDGKDKWYFNYADLGLAPPPIDYSLHGLAYFKFDGDCKDSGPGGYDMYYCSPYFMDGVLGQAKERGVGQSGAYGAQIPGDISTLDFWFQKNSSVPQNRVINYVGDPNDPFSFGEISFRQLNADATKAEIGIQLYAADGSQNCYGSSVFSGTPIQAADGDWVHVVVTWDGTNKYTYANGVLIDTEACGVQFSNVVTQPNYLGNYDNVVYTDVIYSQSDVDFSYNGGAGREFNLI